VIPAPQVMAPYPYLEEALNLARTRLNDAIASIGGDILTDTATFTGTMTNGAWRNMQAFLANLGYSRYKKWFIGLAYPPTAALDPAVMNFLSWTQFFDGVGYRTNVPLLPFDFICPLRVMERQNNGAVPYSAGTQTVPFTPMRLMPDGIPECFKRPWNGFFNWENDQLVFPGSTYSMDFKIEYAAYSADFLTTDNILGNPNANPPITPANMQVPVMRSESCLANYIAAECASGRDDMDAAPFLAAAEKDAKLLMNNSDVKLKQRRPVQRRSYAGSRGGGSGYGYGSSGY
jgi:hypothetical protein